MKMEQRKRLIVTFSPKPEFEADDDIYDQFYLPARGLAILRPQDVIILPNNEAVHEFANFLINLNFIHPDQIYWTSGKNYLMDTDVNNELIPVIKRLTQNGEWAIYPYSASLPFKYWADKLNMEIISDTCPIWNVKYTSKRFLHPNMINDEYQHTTIKQICDVAIPKGYTCRSINEMNLAFIQLQAEGVEEFIVKPADGSTGEGIFVVKNMEEFKNYKFKMGHVVLEENLTIDRDVYGHIIAPSIQFIGKNMSHEITDQRFCPNGIAFAGNVSPSRTSKDFQEELFRITKRILETIQPKGPGGLDFLSVGGKPILVDPNLGRITGAHPAIQFRNRWAPNACFKTCKVCDDHKISAQEFWAICQKAGIAFVPGKSTSGVFPLCMLKDMWGMVIMLADNHDELDRLSDKVLNCLS